MQLSRARIARAVYTRCLTNPCGLSESLTPLRTMTDALYLLQVKDTASSIRSKWRHSRPACVAVSHLDALLDDVIPVLVLHALHDLAIELTDKGDQSVYGSEL